MKATLMPPLRAHKQRSPNIKKLRGQVCFFTISDFVEDKVRESWQQATVLDLLPMPVQVHEALQLSVDAIRFVA